MMSTAIGVVAVTVGIDAVSRRAKEKARLAVVGIVAHLIMNAAVLGGRLTHCPSHVWAATVLIASWT